MELGRTKQAIYEYLITPSPLFLKQVVEIAETKAYILVRDTRVMKKRAIPDVVIQNFEDRLLRLCSFTCRCETYDGVSYLLLEKEPRP